MALVSRATILQARIFGFHNHDLRARFFRPELPSCMIIETFCICIFVLFIFFCFSFAVFIHHAVCSPLFTVAWLLRESITITACVAIFVIAVSLPLSLFLSLFLSSKSHSVRYLFLHFFFFLLWLLLFSSDPSERVYK